MAKSPLIDWSPPEDHARAFRLVGEFMFHWASMESEINRGMRKLLGIGMIEGMIVTANTSLRDKTNILKTAVNHYCGGQTEWLQQANKTINSIGNLTPKRNLIAHTSFIPHENGGVEFFVIKAKSTFGVPDEIWSIEEFLRINHEVSQLEGRLKEISDHALKSKKAIKELSEGKPGNAFALLLRKGPSPSEDTPPLGLLDILPHLPPEPLGSVEAKAEKPPRKKPKTKPKAPRSKPKG